MPLVLQPFVQYSDIVVTGVPAWREVVRMEKRDTSLIELKYRTLSPPKDGFEASLVAVVNNVTVVAVTSFFLVRHRTGYHALTDRRKSKQY